MSAGEQTKNEAQREPEDDTSRQLLVKSPDDGRELPLFLRDISDGQKGNAQDEKDEMGE